MRNLCNISIGLAICSLLGACHTDEIPGGTGDNASLELLSVSMTDKAETKAVTTSVTEVRLHLASPSSSHTYKYENNTWGCTDAPSLSTTSVNVYAFHPIADGGSDIAVTSSSNDFFIPVTIRSSDTFDSGQIDYLYGIDEATTGVATASSTSKSISLTMYHALAKVGFQVYKATSASDEELKLTKIEIRSGTGRLQTGTGSMRLKDGALIGLAGSSSVELAGEKVLQTSLTQPNVSCLLAPMNAEEQVLSFRLTVKVGTVERVFETSSVQKVQWLANRQYVYKIRIDKMEGIFEGVTVYNWQNSTDQNTSVGI